MANTKRTHKISIYCGVVKKLESLITSTSKREKRAGINLLGLLEHLPVDYEDELFGFNTDKPEKHVFPIDITDFMPPNSGYFSIQVYPVEKFLRYVSTYSLITHNIYAIKILKKPGNEFRLFFFLDEDLHVVVYLLLEERPYNRIESEWEYDIINAYVNFIHSEKPAYSNHTNLTGLWIWI